MGFLVTWYHTWRMKRRLKNGEILVLRHSKGDSKGVLQTSQILLASICENLIHASLPHGTDDLPKTGDSHAKNTSSIFPICST